ncbi:hypothetical protein, partial [Nonomuraea roseoviolacea]|uniref:hypothetical protein n=1 Tax=Nonomuraea roseoviolacea TaxID=103837 RepID=UPI0031E85238
MLLRIPSYLIYAVIALVVATVAEGLIVALVLKPAFSPIEWAGDRTACASSPSPDATPSTTPACSDDRRRPRGGLVAEEDLS